MNETQARRPASADKILLTKLMIPRQQEALVRRTAALERMDEGLSKKLTLVTAPTGSGKTTLVSMWVTERPVPAAWVTLDESDNDTVRFWSYTITALRSISGGASAGKAALAALRTSQQPSFIEILTNLLNELGRFRKPSVLVLEDFHAITSLEVLKTLSFLLDYLPEALHVVIISRKEPALGLAVLRARNELAEIGNDDLRFSQAETEDFVRKTIPAALSAAAIAQLNERSEGWAAGLRLVSLALQHQSDIGEAERQISAFSGSHRYVFDYLLKEAFDSQSTAIQAFLLQTCFLERLSGPLCDALTGRDDGAAVLAQLERSNLFITRLGDNDASPWYRYHSFFAEALRYLARQHPAEVEVSRLFENASRWYEEHRLLDEAIEAALKAELFERAANLIEQFIELHGLFEFQNLRRWVELLPKEILYQRPDICFSYAMLLLFSPGRFSPTSTALIQTLLKSAEDSWLPASSAEMTLKLGQVFSASGVNAWNQHKYEQAMQWSRQALDLLPEDETTWRGMSLLIIGQDELSSGDIQTAQGRLLEALALFGAAQNKHGTVRAIEMLGQVYYWLGELQQSNQFNQQALNEEGGDDDLQEAKGQALLTQAKIAYEQNELEKAESLTVRAQEAGRQRSSESIQVYATILLAQIQHARGYQERARELLQTFSGQVRQPHLLRELQTARAWLALKDHEESQLKNWLGALTAQEQNIIYLQREREILLLARLYTSQDKAGTALDLLKDLQTNAGAAGRIRSQVEILCAQALAYSKNSDPAQASLALTAALEMAQPAGYRRLFLDEGEPMAGILQKVTATLSKRSLAVFAGSLQQAFALAGPPKIASSAAVSSYLIEPLSPQELRVLRLLAAGLSNPDIARELVVSTNTIKTQVKNIYRKLNIASREEARAAAYDLKLL
ncbi:MAG: LuxR C-terminal-related transcriptional regulator [Anaerolineaceae bacterium]|nr:LuxR C-terminal-related transcriptional regulator [Anaerolineaceae bacterium]